SREALGAGLAQGAVRVVVATAELARQDAHVARKEGAAVTVMKTLHALTQRNVTDGVRGILAAAESTRRPSGVARAGADVRAAGAPPPDRATQASMPSRPSGRAGAA